MPFEIIRGDITETKADAIVNTANPDPVIGSGVDAGIHKKAGAKLLKARKKIDSIPVGQAAVTPAFDLDAKFVIHAVVPVWEGEEHGEETLLRQCYDNALALAAKKRCKSVAFPLLSAGNDGFPKAAALQIAVSAFLGGQHRRGEGGGALWHQRRPRSDLPKRQHGHRAQLRGY